MTQQEATKRWWAEADRDQIHLAAAEWFARLRDPDVRLEDTLAWQAWMSDDPRHAEAFARLEDVSSALQSVPRPGRPSGTEARRDAYDGSVPIRDWRERLEFLNRGQAWVGRRIAAALPRIQAPTARTMLQQMHDSHLANIERCKQLITARGP